MKDIYESPLSSRYADQKMKYLFSPDMKFRTWRKLWIALAEAEKELGLPVTQEQIDEMKAHQDDINYDVAENGKRKSVTMLCLMYTLSASSARRRNRLFTWGLPPAM